MAEEFYGAEFEEKFGKGKNTYETDSTSNDVLSEILEDLDEYELDGKPYGPSEIFSGEKDGEEVEIMRDKDGIKIFLEPGYELDDVLEPENEEHKFVEHDPSAGGSPT